jgi:predicted secreted Zn-dependent protease
MRRCLALLFLAGCAHHAAVETVESTPSPGVHLTSRTIFYAVRGASVGELRQAMRRIGPIDDGGHRSAFTWGMFAWHFPYARGDDGCRTGPVSVEVEVTQTYPEWIGRAGSAAAVEHEWSRWLAALTAHEDGHRQILLSAAQQIAGFMAALPAQPTCDEANLIANRVGGELLNKMRTQQVDYDRQTEHGIKTGAKLNE